MGFPYQGVAGGKGDAGKRQGRKGDRGGAPQGQGHQQQGQLPQVPASQGGPPGGPPGGPGARPPLPANIMPPPQTPEQMFGKGQQMGFSPPQGEVGGGPG